MGAGVGADLGLSWGLVSGWLWPGWDMLCWFGLVRSNLFRGLLGKFGAGLGLVFGLVWGWLLGWFGAGLGLVGGWVGAGLGLVLGRLWPGFGAGLAWFGQLVWGGWGKFWAAFVG